MASLKDLIVHGTSKFISNVFGNIIHANKFVTNGGTSSQFVKGDGTLDDSTYLTSATTPQYTITKLTTAETGYIASYELKKDGTKVGDTINIPKDYLVKSGTIEIVTTANVPYQGAVVGDKYLDFVVNTYDTSSGSGTTSHIYIPVNDLVDVYTEGNGIDISNSNVVSIKIDPTTTNSNGLETTSAGLKLNTATQSSAGALSAADKTKLDGIAAGAEVNVQSDWNQSDNSKDSYIKNKPAILVGNNSSTIRQTSSSWASGTNSCAFGYNTSATSGVLGEFAQGKYNVSDSNCISSIGIGTSSNDRKNAVTVLHSGEMYLYGVGDYTGISVYNKKSLQEVLTSLVTSTNSIVVNITSTPINLNEKINGVRVKALAIPVDTESNIYNGDLTSSTTVLPYLSNQDKHLELELGELIKNNYVITEASLSGIGLYTNLSIMTEDNIVKMWSMIPLDVSLPNIKNVLLKYYISLTPGQGDLEEGAIMWIDCFNTGIGKKARALENGFIKWEDYIENYVGKDYYGSWNGYTNGSNLFKYTGETFNWNGETYYLWSDEISEAFIILTDTIDYDTLYLRSLASDSSNENRAYIAIGRTEEQGEDFDYKEGNNRDWLVNVYQDNTGLYLTFDDFIDTRIDINSNIYSDLGDGATNLEDMLDYIFSDFESNYAEPQIGNGGHKYVYTGETFDWNDELFYLWEKDPDYDTNAEESGIFMYMLTETIDSYFLSENSLEYNPYTLYIPQVAFLDNDMEDGYIAGKHLDWRILKIEQ